MCETIGPKTNIRVDVKQHFQAMLSGKYDSFALFSCTFDGEPTSVIVNVNIDETHVDVTPLFVAVTDSMLDKLRDHDGRVPRDGLEERKHGD